MGVQDRDWHGQERRRKERLHYDPKSFRGSRADAASPPRRGSRFGAALLVALALALGFAPAAGRWLQERLAGHAGPAAASSAR